MGAAQSTHQTKLLSDSALEETIILNAETNIHRHKSITVRTLDEFEVAFNSCVHGKPFIVDGKDLYPTLNSCSAVSIHLNGIFARVDTNGELNWGLIEEVQMSVRLNGIPDGVWATLRQSSPKHALYCDIVRLY